MERSETICAVTDNSDLDARYAAGELSETEAESFEEHFMACERCWSLVQRAVEIRAVAGRVPVARVEQVSPYGRPSRWLALAAAAAIVFVVGTWQTDAWRRPLDPGLALRGNEDSLRVVARTQGTTLVVSWDATRLASSYRVRLYSATGTVLHQREVSDTTLSIRAESLPAVPPGTVLFWEVQALDRTRQVVLRSGLREVRLPRLAG